MPYADPDRRRANSKRWRDEGIAKGYGKALYARRAQRYANEEILRAACQDALAWLEAGSPVKAVRRLRAALREAPPVGKPIEYMPK